MGIMDVLREETNLPVVIANHQGLIIYVNAPFEKTFQWTSDEILNRPIATIIPKELHDAHNLGFSRFLSTGQSTILNQSLELAAVNKSGVQFLAEHTIYAEKIDDAWVFGAKIRPFEK